MIVQNSAVQRCQWLSFLCCYVICEMEKTICPLDLPPFEDYTEFSKKCLCTNESAAHNLCNEMLGVLF